MMMRYFLIIYLLMITSAEAASTLTLEEMNQSGLVQEQQVGETRPYPAAQEETWRGTYPDGMPDLNPNRHPQSNLSPEDQQLPEQTVPDCRGMSDRVKEILVEWVKRDWAKNMGPNDQEPPWLKQEMQQLPAFKQRGP